MPLNPDAKLPSEWSDWHERSWTSKDSLLYALGVGAGASDPTGFELEFTTENSRDVTQRALPTMAVILGGGGGRMGDIGTFNPAFLVSGGRVAVAEGWNPGPSQDKGDRWDPAELGDVIPKLVAEAAPIPGMQ